MWMLYLRAVTDDTDLGSGAKNVCCQEEFGFMKCFVRVSWFAT